MSPASHFEVTQSILPANMFRTALKLFTLLISILIGISSWQVANAKGNNDKDFPKVGAVSESPTNAYLPGKAIWVDLVTMDVAMVTPSW